MLCSLDQGTRMNRLCSQIAMLVALFAAPLRAQGGDSPVTVDSGYLLEQARMIGFGVDPIHGPHDRRTDMALVRIATAVCLQLYSSDSTHRRECFGAMKTALATVLI